MARKSTPADADADADADATLHHVATLEAFDEAERIIVDIKGREIAVFDVEGEFHAVLNYCTHQGGPLCEGLLDGTLTMTDDWEWTYSCEGTIVSCPWHGWEFDITTGEHLAHSDYRVPTYDVVVRDGHVYISE